MEVLRRSPTWLACRIQRSLDENFQFVAGELGAPYEKISFSERELDHCEDRPPRRLVESMAYSGNSIYLDGGMTICPPSEFSSILALVFKADDDLNHKDCSVISYGAFGELSVWSRKYGLISINLVEGEVSSPMLAPSEFKSGLVPKAEKTPDPNVVSAGAIMIYEDDYDFLDCCDPR